MTFDTLFNDLKSVYEYFITVFGRLIVYINSQPLLVLGVLVTVTLPAVYLIISFIIFLSDSSEDITTEGFRIYRIFKNKKIQKEEKERRESFKKDTEFNRQMRYEQGKKIANTFFSNNPNRMTVRVNGFTYYQEGFENKHWGNSKRTRVTKKYKISENGEIYHSNTSITSTETYDNTSSEQLEEKYDAD